VIHQPPVERCRELRQQREPIAFGEQQQQLPEDGVQLPLSRQQRLHDGAFLHRGDRRVHQRPLQRLVSGHQRREADQLAVHQVRVDVFLHGDVEQRPRIAGRRPAGGHCASFSCAA
jgi:hypothetical protein